MRSSKPALLSIALLCFSLIGAALYLQLVKNMLPCPLCVIQRYLFIFIGIFCLLAASAPAGLQKIMSALAALTSLGGIGVAAHHVYILANPQLSCGIDPLETGLNKIFLANWWPTLFRADGLCDTPYEPTLGLSIPAWALLWFGIFGLGLLAVLFSRKKPGMFGKLR